MGRHQPAVRENSGVRPRSLQRPSFLVAPAASRKTTAVPRVAHPMPKGSGRCYATILWLKSLTMIDSRPCRH